METLTIVDALDERDFLRKRILAAISSARFVAARRIKDTKISGKTIADMNSEAVATYQSIRDNIDRYHRLDVAITESNAKTIIELRSGKRMTVAAAIAMRKSLKDGDCLEEKLMDTLQEQYNGALRSITQYNTKANTELEQYKAAKLAAQGKDTKLTDDQVKVIEAFVADLYGELVDPLDMAHKLNGILDEQANIRKELDSAIKISNATTTITF